MLIILLIAGICAVLAGLVAIYTGIPVKEFSFGNTLILVGALAVCTGMIMFGQALIVRELKNIARRLAPRSAAEARPRVALPPLNAPAMTPADDSSFFPGELPAAESAPADLPPWREESAARDRGRQEFRESAFPDDPAEPAPAGVAKRRSLLSSASAGKERGQPRGSPPELSAPEAAEPPSFDNSWPKAERSRSPEPPPLRRPLRPPSTFTEPGPRFAEGEGRREDKPAVTVLKAGVVDGMAYSLYSDGSIEAQMPEGMMRFSSIDELRAHLDQRP